MPPEDSVRSNQLGYRTDNNASLIIPNRAEIEINLELGSDSESKPGTRTGISTEE